MGLINIPNPNNEAVQEFTDEVLTPEFVDEVIDKMYETHKEIVDFLSMMARKHAFSNETLQFFKF